MTLILCHIDSPAISKLSVAVKYGQQLLLEDFTASTEGPKRKYRVEIAYKNRLSI